MEDSKNELKWAAYFLIDDYGRPPSAAGERRARDAESSPFELYAKVMDEVTQNIEIIVKDLAVLEALGAISPQESKSILATRSKYESLVSKRARCNERAFTAYISYELSLARTLNVRFKATRRCRTALSSFRRHLRGVFSRAVRRNSSCLQLWYIFTKYCEKNGSDALLSRVLTAALRHHSQCEGLWLHAAAFEFRKHNMHGARSILQNALRTCPGSKEIWLAYFKLELVYAKMVASRKSILLPDVPHNKSADKENPLNIEEGAVALLVFQKAIERYEGLRTTADILRNLNISQDQDLFLRMVCIATQFQNSSRLLQHMSSIDTSGNRTADLSLSSFFATGSSKSIYQWIADGNLKRTPQCYLDIMACIFDSTERHRGHSANTPATTISNIYKEGLVCSPDAARRLICKSSILPGRAVRDGLIFDGIRPVVCCALSVLTLTLTQSERCFLLGLDSFRAKL